jgi:hypothetical protein
MVRSKSATLGGRPAPKKKKNVSAALNFLSQTLGIDPNPHHSLTRMSLAGQNWGIPVNEKVANESRRDMINHGFSHEGEGRAGYLRATYQKAPRERNVMPVTTNQMIGFTAESGPMKLFPAKQHKPGVKQFFSTTHNYGLKRPEIGNLRDDAMYVGTD